MTNSAADVTHKIITEPPRLGNEDSADITEEVKLERTRNCSIIEGTASNIATGLGESYITAFAVAINSSNTVIALLTAIPNLIAPLAQLLTPKAMEKYGRKRLIIPGVFAQACMWLIIASVAFFFINGFQYSPYLLLIFYTIYSLLGNFIAPAWTSLMGDVIPKNKGEYWARRSTICGIAGLIVTLFAGIFLDAFKDVNLMLSFAVIFVLSFVGRTISSYMFTKHYEPELKLPKGYYFSFTDFVKRMQRKDNNFGNYTLFISLGIFAGYIAWPFIPVYMLKELNFDYTTFTIITITEAVSSLITLSIWGKYVDKNGNIKALWYSCLGLALVPVLWAVSSNVVYLIAVQFFKGVVSAGFAIASTNYLFDSVTPQRRSLCYAYSGILQGIGIFFGSVLGGVLLLFNFGISSFIVVFLVAGGLRLIISAIMLPHIKEANKGMVANGNGGTNQSLTAL